MGNSRSSGVNKEYATIDTQPGAAGYFSNSVSVRYLRSKKKISKVFFSIRETNTDISAAPSALSTITVVLQFMCEGDLGWTDYIPLDASTLAIGNRFEIGDLGASVHWRAGVVSDGFTSGSVTFGFDW